MSKILLPNQQIFAADDASLGVIGFLGFVVTLSGSLDGSGLLIFSPILRIAGVCLSAFAWSYWKHVRVVVDETGIAVYGWNGKRIFVSQWDEVRFVEIKTMSAGDIDILIKKEQTSIALPGMLAHPRELADTIEAKLKDRGAVETKPGGLSLNITLLSLP